MPFVIPTKFNNGRIEKKATLDNLVDSRFDAIVDINGNGNYTSISAALSAGHKSVYVRKGTYTESVDLVVPDGGTLIGESPSLTIINFNGAVKSLWIDGSGGIKEEAGTIDITSNSTTITGTGTTFTNLSAGDHILIGDVYFEIDSITNNTSLELVNSYKGITQTGIDYIAQSVNTGATITSLTVANSGGNGLRVRAGNHTIVSIISVESCTGDNILIEDSSSSVLSSISSRNSGGHGINLSNSRGIGITTSEFSNNTSDGANINNKTRDAYLETNIFTTNGGNGVKVDGTSDKINLIDSFIAYNVLIGLTSLAGNKDVVVDSCIIDNNGQEGVKILSNFSNVSNSAIANNGDDGIEVSSKSTITGLHVHDNTGHGVFTSGVTSSSITSCIVQNNTIDGIHADNSDFLVVTGNVCTDNGDEGIEVTETCNNVIVTNNIALNNTGDPILVNGNNTIVTNNQTV